MTSRALSIATVSVEDTQREITKFMFGRANQLVHHQPELLGLLTASRTGLFNLQATQSAGALRFATDTNSPLWIDLSASWGRSGSSDTEYVLGTIGWHTAVSENLLVGMMLEIDFYDQTSASSRVSGTGWLVGPYVVAKLPHQPIFFEGRVLYGQTSNEVSPLSAYTNRFETERWLIQAELSGHYKSSRSVFIPNMTLSYTSDTQREYLDVSNKTIPRQDIELMTLSFGADFSIPVSVSFGSLEFKGGLNGIWASTNGGGNASLVIPSFEGGRVNVDFGFTLESKNGISTSANFFYDGFGTDEYENFGVGIQLVMNF